MRAASLGGILGVFGLLLLLTSPLTLLVTSGSVTVFAVKALVGAGLLGVYFATNYRQFGQFASRRSSFFFAHSALLVLAVLGALGALNYLAHQKNRRWDLTDNKVFTLSTQTRETLAGLSEPVRVTAFIPPEHPAYEGLRTTFERYHVAAPERFDYAFKDPRRYPDLVARYKLQDGQMQVVLTRGEGDQQAYLMLQVISELELTSAIVRLMSGRERRVYFTIGHGEWPLDQAVPRPGQNGRPVSLSAMKQQLVREGYTPRELNLGGGTNVPPSTALVVIAGPKAVFTPPEVESLRVYLAAGGRLLYFAEAYGEAGPGMERLLASYGVGIEPGVVADAQFNGGNPYVVVSLFYGDHDLVRPLRQRQLNTEFPTARGLLLRTDDLVPGARAQPVVLTSPFGWVETTPDDKPVPNETERKGQIPLVIASTRDTAQAPLKRSDETRLVVVGDSELLFDSNWGHEGNRNLVMNVFGWATQQDDKITLRAPDRAHSSFPLDAELLGRIRFISTDVLPLLLLGVGLAIWLARRNQ